jgi:hypothetical protein
MAKYLGADLGKDGGLFGSILDYFTKDDPYTLGSGVAVNAAGEGYNPVDLTWLDAQENLPNVFAN